MDTVTAVGSMMIDDFDRIAATRHLGVDETVFLSAGRKRRRQLVSSVTDVEARTVLDVFEGRQSADLVAWFADRPADRVSGGNVVVADLHEPFRNAFNERVPRCRASHRSAADGDGVGCSRRVGDADADVVKGEALVSGVVDVDDSDPELGVGELGAGPAGGPQVGRGA